MSHVSENDVVFSITLVSLNSRWERKTAWPFVFSQGWRGDPTSTCRSIWGGVWKASVWGPWTIDSMGNAGVRRSILKEDQHKRNNQLLNHMENVRGERRVLTRLAWGKRTDALGLVLVLETTPPWLVMLAVVVVVTENTSQNKQFCRGVEKRGGKGGRKGTTSAPPFLGSK